LQQIIELQLSVAQTILPFKLHFHTIHEQGTLVEEEKFVVRCFRTNHRVECYGFYFQEKKKPRKINPDKAKKYDIPSGFYERLQNGEDYTQKDGSVVKNEWVTDAGTKAKAYAYCADTKYDESMIPHLQGADMIYHETTYLDNLRERADFRFHSTTKQAGLFAQKADAKKLLIGHFSSKYDTLDEFEKETREVFPNTELALEGVAYTI
jgi:ribonuclease Z